MSLRARLIASVLALAAVGLVALGAVTYLEQRSFLSQRVDEQARAAFPFVARRLDQLGIGGPANGFAPPGRPDDDGGRGRGRPGGGPGADFINLPPGTFGERRDAAGHAIGAVTLFAYGQRGLPSPRLPAHVPTDHLITVSSRGGGGMRYRVAAFTAFDGGTTIVAVPLTEVDQTLSRLLLVEALVIAAVLVALAAAAWWLVRLELRPLDRMEETAGAIAAGDLSRRVSPATPKTEVGRLGLALNAMLGQIERAFAQRQASEDRLRQFLADASHELRTPLSSIRGYAELFRIGAAREADDTERAMARIEEEAARMGVLVEDLLALARLDEVREHVPEPVDVAALVEDAAADARAAAPDRELRVETGDDVIALGDGDQIRQVLANLVRNALVHTPPGTPVELSARRAGDEVELEVRDHGPGLPEGRREELFERFWRADPGRGRGPAGAGLGLAIVAAIVAAHGGRVEARDAEGGGASFVVALAAPLDSRPEPEDAQRPLSAR